ncbi:MAG: hypothetical protein ABI091_13015 [Ferruginibacter sp.]
MDDKKLDNRINETLNSFDGAEKATPAPYLMTRINARMQKEGVPGFWANAFTIFSKPVFAIAVLGLLILNMIVITQKQNTDTGASQNTTTTKYDFAINVSSMYDVENQ